MQSKITLPNHCVEEDLFLTEILENNITQLSDHVPADDQDIMDSGNELDVRCDESEVLTNG
jgi:hypothetical protein